MIKPWEAEPDSLNFRSHGLRCAIRRGPMGAWCGYVAVPVGHPLHGKAYSDKIKNPPEHLIERKIDIDKVGVINIFCAGADSVPIKEYCELVLLLDVHGGLTFASDRCPGQRRGKSWWFGFDCGHAGDLSPKFDAEKVGRPDYEYRDQMYVMTECRSLTQQLCSWGIEP